MYIYVPDMKFLWSNLWLGGLSTGDTGCHTMDNSWLHRPIGIDAKWALWWKWLFPAPMFREPVKIFGLSFERPYLIKGLNLMIAKSIKSADFNADFEIQNPQFWNQKSVVSKLKICRFCWNLHFSLRFQQGNIYGQTKDHLPRKVTPIFNVVGNWQGTGCTPASRVNAWLVTVVWNPYYRTLRLSLGCDS